MKNLVLLGAGMAHVQLLSRLVRQPAHGTRITLIAPYSPPLYAPMLAGFVAGRHTLENCLIPLETLIRRAGVLWLNRPLAALDVNARTIQLDSGGTFGFDWLSVNDDLAPGRQQIEGAIPGAREHGLFLHPLVHFCGLWPRVAELGASRAVRVAVLGATQEAIELALAVRQRLPNASVTLASDNPGLTDKTRGASQRRHSNLLSRKNITLLPDLAARIEAEQVVMSSGVRLACDVALLASSGLTPKWLAQSGLGLDGHGFVALDAYRRSLTHPYVYAAQDLGGRADTALVKNLISLLSGAPARADTASSNTVRFTSYGRQRAMIEWGWFSAQGRWVGWLKDWLDRRYLRRYGVY